MTELAPVFALLARLILREVDEALLKVLRQADILEVLDKAEPGCAAYLSGPAWEPETSTFFEALDVDFTGLFIVPQGVQPQASAWLPGERELVGGHVASLVNQAVAALELQPVDPALSQLPADHLALLLSITAQTLGSDDPKAQEMGRGLFEQTLAPWLPDIGARIQARADTPLYRAVGVLLTQLPV